MSNRRRLVISTLILFLFLVLGIFVITYIKSAQKLSIIFANESTGIKATVYRVTLDNHEVGYENRIDKDNPVREFVAAEEVTLKKGEYVLITSGNEDYIKRVINFTLDDKPETITINPEYSETKLSALLKTDKDVLKKLISTSYPRIINSYDVSDGKLYQNGDWYTTILYPKQTEEQKRLGYVDVYRLVAHKKSGVWKIITDPPELIVNIHNYPTIPRDILVDLNKQ